MRFLLFLSKIVEIVKVSLSYLTSDFSALNIEKSRGVCYDVTIMG